MPSERTPFTPSSILFRPRQNPQSQLTLSKTALLRALVEAPGTAPGSDELITMTIYRHSRTNPTHLI